MFIIDIYDTSPTILSAGKCMHKWCPPRFSIIVQFTNKESRVAIYVQDTGLVRCILLLFSISRVFFFLFGPFQLHMRHSHHSHQRHHYYKHHACTQVSPSKRDTLTLTSPCYSQIVTVITSIKITGIKPNGKQNCNYVHTTSTLWWVYDHGPRRHRWSPPNPMTMLGFCSGAQKYLRQMTVSARKKGRNYPSYSSLLMCFPNH